MFYYYHYYFLSFSGSTIYTACIVSSCLVTLRILCRQLRDARKESLLRQEVYTLMFRISSPTLYFIFIYFLIFMYMYSIYLAKEFFYFCAKHVLTRLTLIPQGRLYSKTRKKKKRRKSTRIHIITC